MKWLSRHGEKTDRPPPTHDSRVISSSGCTPLHELWLGCSLLGFFPLENIVHIDMDMFRRSMPEWPASAPVSLRLAMQQLFQQHVLENSCCRSGRSLHCLSRHELFCFAPQGAVLAAKCLLA